MSKKGFAAAVAAIALVGGIALFVLYGTLGRYRKAAPGSADAPPESSAPAAGAPAGSSAPGGASSAAPEVGTLTAVGEAMPPPAPAESQPPPPPASDREKSVSRAELESLLAIRAPLREYYDQHLDDLYQMGDLFESGQLAQGVKKYDVILKLKRFRDEGLKKEGLPMSEYNRIVGVVYDRWFRATGGGQTDLAAALASANAKLEETIAGLGGSDLSKDQEDRLYWQRVSLQEEIKRLEWARSQTARDMLAAMDPGTRALLDANKDRIRGAALLEADLLLF